MLFGKKQADTDGKVKEMPELVGRALVTDFKQNPDVVWKLKAVVRDKADSKDIKEVRVFDETKAAAKGVRVGKWSTLDEHPDLLLYEGWFNKKVMSVELTQKNAP